MDRRDLKENYVTLKPSQKRTDILSDMLVKDSIAREVLENLKTKYGIDTNWDYMWNPQSQIDMMDALGEFLVPAKTKIGPFKFRFGKPSVFRTEDLDAISEAFSKKLAHKHDFWKGFQLFTEVSFYSMMSAHNRAIYRKWDLEREDVSKNLFLLEDRSLIQTLVNQMNSGYWESREVMVTFETAIAMDNQIEKYKAFKNNPF